MASSLALVLCLASLAQAAVKLSDFVSPCSIKDPNLGECMKTGAQAILPHMVAGIREWGIPPVDPLLVPHVTLQKGGGGSVGLSFNITDVSIYGWKGCRFNEIKYDPKNYEFEMELFLPIFNPQGDYEVAGQILLLPVKGKGRANIIFKDATTRIKLTCEPESRGKDTYLKIVKRTVKNTIPAIVFDLKNLFGNKELSDNMNAVLTENGAEVAKDLEEPLENILGDVVETIVARILKKLPLNKLFKDV